MHVRELPGACDLLSLAAAFPARYPCLLESVASGPAQARWDLLLAFPQSRIQLDADGCTQIDDERFEGRFLDALDAAWSAERTPRDEDGLPFHGGWALLLAYELIAEVESRLTLPSAPGPQPVALALRTPAAVLVDHAADRTLLVAEAGHAELIEAMQSDMRASSPLPPLALRAKVDEDAPSVFLDGVARVHEYLRSGDVFQVNLSRCWRSCPEVPAAPAQVYAALREANPAPFAGLWQDPGWAVVSSSPERLVEVRGEAVQTRPIAGTRPRFAGDDERARIDELVGHPKERAEHIMLIDLERNDLGRVCAPGSVEVDELMTVESYAHVHHIVSNVRGRLRAEVTPGQVIAATFPGGTITGCPKVRCMEIIAELEGVGRGAYTGAMGYLDRNGDMDLNILIRTLSLFEGHIELRAGAGIVVDSQAEAELEETRHKARGLLRALGVEA
ncbi:aminodeoxychorismate synthase component I [Oleiagrimonas citrea]|uniref:Aminodeoxychorismate synthase component I n=2 Tax=Oleiagrimonas citrea TaxID=1665687 RepID=A0A846ZJM6_9GAMM|nr:aminodeoxychorismate synthase component I [Oleiagrimonas citrea]NKZ37758.1 aminodeoxychorismate synthase component I [Oleiagrimonas citrea]